LKKGGNYIITRNSTLAELKKRPKCRQRKKKTAGTSPDTKPGMPRMTTRVKNRKIVTPDVNETWARERRQITVTSPLQLGGGKSLKRR